MSSSDSGEQIKHGTKIATSNIIPSGDFRRKTGDNSIRHHPTLSIYLPRTHFVRLRFQHFPRRSHITTIAPFWGLCNTSTPRRVESVDIFLAEKEHSSFKNVLTHLGQCKTLRLITLRNVRTLFTTDANFVGQFNSVKYLCMQIGDDYSLLNFWKLWLNATRA
ncbi:hypothetical protein BDP27DRAFT_1367653 [Rhodocollybia butyracea]|uniref:Uncharacterized protein n=1 Tax=Rhodocollybia butyracea TaxID=206335 RepID=A0A9P5PJR4_9AGAR|nr:hypothetical protein BDP27DRAFT_1367653 [Rhodocollybia butyracea]